MTTTPTVPRASAVHAPQIAFSPHRPPAVGRRRRPAAWLLALLVTSLASSASAEEISFSQQPIDSTVVEGHMIAFRVVTNLDTSTATYQWYRNEVAIDGATAASYRFSPQFGDNGAHYHVVADGTVKGGTEVVPKASNRATLTVMPAGSSLPPAITAPSGDAVYNLAYVLTNAQPFQAIGNDLQWTYRFDSEPPDSWHVLSADTNGTQWVMIDTIPPAGGTRITVRVLDDAGAVAVRTWALVVNQSPTLVSSPTVTPGTVTWPGPVTCTISGASDPDGDPLTYTWSKVDGPGDATAVTFVPNGTGDSATCTATFKKFGVYNLQVTVSDGHWRGNTPAAPVSVSVTGHSDVDSRADVNGDGIVDALDLGLVIDYFGQVAP